MTGCPKCNVSHIVKNSHSWGKQRYRCKSCGFQFTRTTPRGRPASEKATAILLYTLKATAILRYTLGLSLNSIARMLKVSTPAVLRWVRLFAEKTYQKPEPSEAVIVELDEMWHYLNSKKTNFGSGKLIVAVPVGSLTGNAGLVIKRLSHDS